MKAALFALPALLLGLTAAAAGTLEAEYVAARDAAIARLKRVEAKDRDAASKMEQKALADLDARLQTVIGPLAVPPYPAKGKLALDTLFENDVGAGALDALRFSREGDTIQQVFVTTDGLMTRWLAKPADWWAGKQKTPPSIEEAVASEEFYTPAISPDAALTKTADLAVKPPAGATFARAMLGGWAQESGPNPNQEIILALRRDGKIYFASEPAKAFKELPACEKVWTDAMGKAEALQKKYAEGGAKDEKLLDDYNKISGKAEGDYRACYRERLPGEPFFPAILSQAQEMADRFGAK